MFTGLDLAELYLPIILAFLTAALMCYLVFAGADFGAGILEGFAPPRFRRQQRQLTTHAMGPVWEANHIWIILAVVILFTAFPTLFAVITTELHLVITLMLFGVVLRGCSFTFRHYDIKLVDKDLDDYDSKDPDPKGEKLYSSYSLVFFSSSLITTLLQGMIVGALILGRLTCFSLDSAPQRSLQEAPEFYTAFMAPWLNPFCFSTGLLLISLYSLLAAVFLSCEAMAKGTLQLGSSLISQARVSVSFTVLAGVLVFIVGELSGLELVKRFSASPASLAMMFVSTILLPVLLISLTVLERSCSVSNPTAVTSTIWIARISSSAVACSILIGLLAAQFPIVIATTNPTAGAGLSILEGLAPLATQKQLVIALIAGSLLIFPSLGYLIKVFKTDQR